MDQALNDGFFLEASWIAYAIIEDRILSALAKTGGVPMRNGQPLRMLGPKLDALVGRQPNDSALTAAMLNGQVLDTVRAWKDKRNPLMHSLAEECKPFVEHNADARIVAAEGSRAARDLCAAVIRLSRRKRR